MVSGAHLALITLLVRDYDEAIAFYTRTLGFQVLEDTDRSGETPGKRWVRVAPRAGGAASAALLLARASTPEQVACIGRQTGGRVFLFMHTDDFWRDFDAMVTQGVQVVRPARHEPYGMVAVIADLYGNLIDVIGPGEARGA